MYIDIYYLIIVLPFVLLAALASASVTATYKRYSREPLSCGMSGADVARMVLRDHGVVGVEVRHCDGELTDHYDPRDNTIYLSDAVYGGTSAAAAGVAAHEAGHAVQHAEEYLPGRIRTALVPVTNIGSRLSVWVILLGILLCLLSEAFAVVAYFGIALFSLTALFQLVTLPVEFNASRRAVETLRQSGYLDEGEIAGTRKVLTAAAMTYVAALAVTLAQILRLVIRVAQIVGRNRD